MLEAERLHDRQVQSPFRYLLFGWRWWLWVVWTLFDPYEFNTLNILAPFGIQFSRWINPVNKFMTSTWTWTCLKMNCMHLQFTVFRTNWVVIYAAISSACDMARATELNFMLFYIRSEVNSHRTEKKNSDESEKFFRSMFIPEKWKSIWKHILCSTQMNKTREEQGKNHCEIHDDRIHGADIPPLFDMESWKLCVIIGRQ